MKGAKASNLEMILFFWKPYKSYVAITFLAMLIFAVMESASIALLYTLFNQTSQAIAKSGTPDKVYKALAFVARIFPVKDIFVLTCVLLIMSNFVKAVFSFLHQFTGFYLSSRTKRDFHDRVFKKFLGADYSFFVAHKHGWLMHRVMTVPLEASTVLDYIPRILVNGLKILSVIVMLFFISPMVTGFIIVLAVVYYFITKVVATKVSYHIGRDKVDELQRQNELSAEAFSGIKQIMLFSAAGSWVKKFWCAVLKYSRLEIRDSIWLLAPPCVMEFFVVAVMAVVLVILKVYHAESFVTILPVVAIFGYAIQKIIPSFNLLGSQRISFSGLLPVLEILYGILNEPQIVKDGHIELKGFDKGISFRYVAFAYPGRDRLFNDLSFDVEKGKAVAIVGASGSGKSTIADLMLRLYQVPEGGIFIDGIPLNDIKIDTWLSRVGVVSQDTFIFHGSIADNISFGVEGAAREAIMDVARMANAHDFIAELPEGYDTVVGDRGVRLSVGQRQRIAIARALLRKPEVLILDEATSSLDNISQKLVQEAINRISRGHTVIMIAHRLSTIMGADRIIVLDQGVIQEAGTHAELMQRQGAYWRLYNTMKHAGDVSDGDDRT